MTRALRRRWTAIATVLGISLAAGMLGAGPVNGEPAAGGSTVEQTSWVTLITGDRVGVRYQPRTVRHSNAVLRSFYEFWIERDDGLLINPVQLDRRGRRPHAHHYPLEPFRAEGKIRYNPKLPKRRPREIPDERWRELFGGLRSNRDRAILALGISNGGRASELLGVRGVDLAWGDQVVRVFRKGTQAEQWLPASPEAFVWIRLYLADLGAPLDLNESLWWTLRRRDRGDGLRRQPMNYEALRAVFRRVNALLGTNYSMHDLRHTATAGQPHRRQEETDQSRPQPGAHAQQPESRPH